jgi:hypothetical protein
MVRQMPRSQMTVFTIEAVNALLPELNLVMASQMQRRAAIEDRLRQLATLVGDVPDAEGVEVRESDPPPVRELKEDLAGRMEEYRRAWDELEALGAVLKDPRTGLVDFYGRVDGRLVWLCWKYGETTLGHYHGLDEGFAGRKPLLPTLRGRHLN